MSCQRKPRNSLERRPVIIAECPGEPQSAPDQGRLQHLSCARTAWNGVCPTGRDNPPAKQFCLAGRSCPCAFADRGQQGPPRNSRGLILNQCAPLVVKFDIAGRYECWSTNSWMSGSVPPLALRRLPMTRWVTRCKMRVLSHCELSPASGRSIVYSVARH